jgi:glutamate/tyrosine decarboxylase-like PLP-dependent enzyme
MMMTKPALSELTLDPEDWQAVRQTAHAALDAALDYQQQVRSKPVWQSPDQASRNLLQQAAPQQGLGEAQVVQEMLDHVVAYPAGHAHPRFWGWVCGTGTPVGMIADMLAAGVNASSGTFNDAATLLESQLIGWMRDLFSFPDTASGIVTSGASIANMIGLAVARDVKLGVDVRNHGLARLDRDPVVYASNEVHSSVGKAMLFLGLGAQNLRKVAVQEDFAIDLEALEQAIGEDLEAGRKPAAIVASAGTVNTGAIDNLNGLADLAQKYDLWFHVDGAIGALAVMSPQLKSRFSGIERADSLAFDFHKWLYVPYEAGCVLIRDGVEHRASFSVAASYLSAPDGGVGAMHDTTNTRGPQLSRGFKALKVWAQIKTYGFEKLGQLHEQNVAHVQYLKQLIDEAPQLERLAAADLNILCFRYLPQRSEIADRDQLNMKILVQLQEKGIAVPSHTRIHGHFALRIANTNHRSKTEDFELLVREVIRIGRELEESL